MIYFLFAIGLILSCLLMAFAYKKIELIKMIILGIGLWFSLYIIAEGIMMHMNKFSITGAMAITAIVLLIMNIMLFTIRGFELPSIKIKPVKYLPLLGILVVGFFISASHRSEVYGTGQDEGLYQIRAWYYMSDENDNVLDFSEYYNIESDQEKKEYIKCIEKQVGYYLMSDDTATDNRVGKAKGETHGINTFPGMLGMWARMFGMASLNGVLTLMYLLAISNVWLVCNNLKLKKSTALIAAVVMTVSPIMIWSSRITLTEIAIAMFITLFFVLFTEEERNVQPLLAAIPLGAACYYHVTITMLIPLLVIIYIIAIFACRSWKYAVGLMLVMVGYIAGYYMMLSSAHTYTENSFQALYKVSGDMLNSYNTGAWIVTCGSMVITFALIMAIKPLRQVICQDFWSIQNSKKASKVFGIIIAVIATIVLGVTVMSAIKSVTVNGLRFESLSSLCYAICTAFIFMPLGFAGVYADLGRLATDKNRLIIYISMLYIVLVYCNVVWPSIYRYFYYARYFTPFICVIVLAGSLMLDKINFKIAIPLVVISTGIMIYQTRVLYTERDLTNYDYEVLENIAEKIGENDAIIILDRGYSGVAALTLPVRATTDADIYFATENTLYERAEYYAGFYNNVYILMLDVGGYGDEDENLSYVYKGTLSASYYNDYVEKGLPYPIEGENYDSPVALYIYEGAIAE